MGEERGRVPAANGGLTRFHPVLPPVPVLQPRGAHHREQLLYERLPALCGCPKRLLRYRTAARSARSKVSWIGSPSAPVSQVHRSRLLAAGSKSAARNRGSGRRASGIPSRAAGSPVAGRLSTQVRTGSGSLPSGIKRVPHNPRHQCQIISRVTVHPHSMSRTR
jgi:hypothetical protein